MSRAVMLSCLGIVITSFGWAGEPSPLKGTWVREMIVANQIANQVVATFTDSRVSVRMSSGTTIPDGRTCYMTLELDGEYAVTKSGIVCCVITGINIDSSHIPDGDAMNGEISQTLTAMSGQPICFRAVQADGELHVSDLKIPAFSTMQTREKDNATTAVMALASGKFKSSTTEKVPFPKLKAAANGGGIIDLIGRILPTSFDAPVPTPNRTPAGSSTAPFVIRQYSEDPKATLTPLLTQTPKSFPQPSGITIVDYSNNPTPVASVQAATPIPPMPVEWRPNAVPTSSIPTIEPVHMESLPTPPAKHLQGTWYREMIIPGVGGGQLILTIKGDRLKAKFVEFGYGDTNEIKSGSYEMYCTYHRGEDGYVVGRCLGVDIDVKNVPEIEMMNEKATGLFAGVIKAEGEPYSFRCEYREGELFVSDMRMKMPGDGDAKSGKDLMTAMTTGKFKLSTTEQVPLPKIGPRKDQPIPQQQSFPPPLPRSGVSTLPPQPLHPALTEPPLMPMGGYSPPPQLPKPKVLATPQALNPAGIYTTEPVPPELRRKWEQSNPPLPPLLPSPQFHR